MLQELFPRCIPDDILNLIIEYHVLFPDWGTTFIQDLIQDSKEYKSNIVKKELTRNRIKIAEQVYNSPCPKYLQLDKCSISSQKMLSWHENKWQYVGYTITLYFNGNYICSCYVNGCMFPKNIYCKEQK